jgi:acyl-CoA synthetase (AMP-forming)/AMP-acid ligase II
MIQVRRLLCLPQFATAAMYTNHVCPIRRSEVAFVMPRFNVRDFIDNCEKFQITELSVVPPMVISILQSPLAIRKKFRSIKLAHGGAAPLGKEVQTKFKALLPHGTPFTQIWGMTETSGLALSFFYPEHDDTGSIGRPIANTDLK